MAVAVNAARAGAVTTVENEALPEAFVMTVIVPAKFRPSPNPEEPQRGLLKKSMLNAVFGVLFSVPVTTGEGFATTCVITG